MAGESKSGQRLERPRVLIVEDEFVILLTLKVQLQAIGCEVVGTARDADTAVELARKLRPDVILMDLGLPGRDGAEATVEIMAEAPTRIVLVTAYGDERVDRAVEAGACVVLTKPITQEQLAKAIADAARSTPGPASG